jgi:hypothetical protein
MAIPALPRGQSPAILRTLRFLPVANCQQRTLLGNSPAAACGAAKALRLPARDHAGQAWAADLARELRGLTARHQAGQARTADLARGLLQARACPADHSRETEPGGSLLPARHRSRGRLSRQASGYDVDASVMSFQLHERGIHTIAGGGAGAADTRRGMRGGAARRGPNLPDQRPDAPWPATTHATANHASNALPRPLISHDTR